MLIDQAIQQVLTASSALVGPNITHLFGPSLSAGASIYLPSDAHYADHVTQRWTLHAAPKYLATIQPATVADVQSIVRIAASNKLPFLATAGGHGVTTTLGKIRNAVKIDLRNFDSVRLDTEKKTVTVGGGIKFSHIVDALNGTKYQFPIGTAHCVGLLGATLGGGVSAAQGVMGLLSDLLQSAEVVTPAGEIVTASRTDNPDLFWALRGAGANFGIVTSATYSVLPAMNGGNVVNANFLFPATMSKRVFETLGSFDDDLPAEMAFNVAALYSPEYDQMLLFVNSNYYGPKREAEKYLKRFDELGPLRSEKLVVPWPEVFSTSYFGVDDSKACARHVYVNMYSIPAIRTDATTMTWFFDELLDFSRSNPNISSTYVIHRFPTQAPLKVADDDSAYPYRDLKMHIQLESQYDDQKQDAKVDEFYQTARQRFSKMSGYEKASVYVNFAHGDEGPEAWYGSRKLARLARLKQKWDSESLFSYFNPVPMDWSEAVEDL